MVSRTGSYYISVVVSSVQHHQYSPSFFLHGHLRLLYLLRFSSIYFYYFRFISLFPILVVLFRVLFIADGVSITSIPVVADPDPDDACSIPFVRWLCTFVTFERRGCVAAAETKNVTICGKMPKIILTPYA